MATATELARITNAIRSEQSVRSRATASEFRGDNMNKDPKAVPYVRTGFSYNANPYTRVNTSGDNLSLVMGGSKPSTTPSAPAKEINWPTEGLSDAQLALIGQIKGDFESKNFSDDTLARINTLPIAVLNAIPIEARANAAIAQNQNFASAGHSIGASLFRGYQGESMSNGNPLLRGGLTQIDVGNLGVGGINSGVESLDIANPLAQQMSFTLGVNAGRMNIGDFFGVNQANQSIKAGNSYYTYDALNQNLRKVLNANPNLTKEGYIDPTSPDARRATANKVSTEISDINKRLSTRTETVDASGKTINDGGFAAGQSEIEALKRKLKGDNGRYTGNYGYGALNAFNGLNFSPTTSNLRITEKVN